MGAGSLPQTGFEAVIRGVAQYARNAGILAAANTAVATSIHGVTGAAGNSPRALARMSYILGRLQFVAISTAAALATISAPVIFAAQFEEQLSRIAGLTETPKTAIEGLRKQILALSRELAISPVDLAAGAYFILSSGIKSTATAMEVLRLAARASTAGLGETATIARALTGIMNSYGLATSDAQKLTDQFVATVKLGSGEAQAYAQTIGTVVPLAAQLGVEFEHVGGILATLTNAGIETHTAITDLKGIFTQLISPSKQSLELFEALGINIVDFRKELDENATKALLHLVEAAHGSVAVLGALFPDVRGLTGILAAFSNQAEAVVSNVDGVTNSVGDADLAFEAAADTVSHKFRVALNNIRLSLTELGHTLLPTATRAIEAVDRHIQEFVERLKRSNVQEELRGWIPAIREIGAVFLDIGRAIGEFFRILQENRAAFIGIVTALAIGLAVFNPGGALLVGLGLTITALTFLRTENEGVSASFLEAKIRVLEFTRALIQAAKVASRIALDVAGAIVGGALGSAFGPPGIVVGAAAGVAAAEALQLSSNKLDTALEAINKELGQTNTALFELGQQKLADEILKSIGQGAFDAAFAIKLYGGQLSAAQAQQIAFSTVDTPGTLRDIARAAAEAGVSVAEFTRQMILSIDVQRTFASAWANTVAISGLSIPPDVQGAIDQLRDLDAALQPPGADNIDDWEAWGQALVDSLSGTAEKAKNPFEDLVKAEQVQEIILEAANMGRITWADVARLWDLGAHEAAQDFARFLRGEISEIGRSIDESFRAIALKWMDSIEAGILDGTLDVLDALNFLENGMIDAARSIVEGLAQQAEQMAEQWQILIDAMTAGLVTIQQVERLFAIGAPGAALEFLRALAGKPGPVTEAIARFRPPSPFRGFQGGGFIPPGPPVPAMLHGPEVIVPLSNIAAMTALSEALRGFTGGIGGGGFRNYGNMNINAGNDGGNRVLRSMTRALGI